MHESIVLRIFYFDRSDLPMDEQIGTTDPTDSQSQARILKKFYFDPLDWPIEEQL